MGQNSTKESRAQAELEKAATKGNLVDAQIAVKEGAQVNLQNKFGWSPLHHACTDGRLDVIKFFVNKCGGSVHAVNGEGATPLMLAITSKSIETIQYLLSQRALVNERQNEGLTALHLAAIMDDANIVRLLRQHGADVNIVDNDGKKPVEFCRADNAALRKSFSENLVKKKPNDKEKQQSSNSNNNDDGDESESASYKSASSDDDQNEMNFENIIKLCATLRQTFDGVQNPDALRRMIAFYDAESTKLKRRLEELEKPKPNNENNNNNNNDDDDDDDGSEDSVENNDDGTPLLKLT